MLRDELLAPNGYLHAAAIFALADTSCGYGCFVARPENIACEATLVHGGRATQVRDATVSDEESGKKLALFRCTQMILYPRDSS